MYRNVVTEMYPDRNGQTEKSCSDDITKEISGAPFVAAEIDETTDVTNKAQTSVILRYVAESEVVCEGSVLEI